MPDSNWNNEVTDFLDKLNHPFRKEIEALRSIILKTNSQLVENIKWNGPNYGIGNEDRITMKIQPPKLIQLIFHRGVKSKAQPKTKILNDEAGLLEWKANDRAVATFRSLQEIEKDKLILTRIINEWIRLTT